MLGFNLATTKDFFCFDDVDHVVAILGKILLGAFIAFFMELAEYLLVSYTSSLTLSVSGIVKVNQSSLYARTSLIGVSFIGSPHANTSNSD